MTLYACGPSGGTGGNPKWDEYPGGRVASVMVRSGDVIDAIQFTLEDGNGFQTPLTHHGGWGGQESDALVLAPYEWISRVEGRYGDVVDAVTFWLSTKNTVEERFMAYGGEGGSAEFQYEAPTGTQIMGLACRSGDKVDALGVILLGP